MEDYSNQTLYIMLKGIKEGVEKLNGQVSKNKTDIALLKGGLIVIGFGLPILFIILENYIN